MKKGFFKMSLGLLLLVCSLFPLSVSAQPSLAENLGSIGRILLYVVLFGAVLIAALILKDKSAGLLHHPRKKPVALKDLKQQLAELNSQELDAFLHILPKSQPASVGSKLSNKLSVPSGPPAPPERESDGETAPMPDSQLTDGANQKKSNFLKRSSASAMLLLFSFLSLPAFAQTTSTSVQPSGLLGEAGIIITIVLLLIPILGALLLMIARLNRIQANNRDKRRLEEARELAIYLKSLPEEEAAQILQNRREELAYQLSHHELSGSLPARDKKGLIQNAAPSGLPFVTVKQKAIKRPRVEPQLSKLTLWFIGCATFWLLFGTTVGEYVGIKFVAPDADQISWLSFGRLRPVHTNAVFWGWASLAMIGLANYAVPVVSNVKLFSYKLAWWTLGLINAAVVLGTLTLMAGINNGGGEYREYIWPVMSLFAGGLVLTVVNYLKTIARRKTKEIYVSNWYIVSALIFTIVIALVAYLPFWQNGLGETIVQGYYMHQGVGMWFMLFTLGLVYYYLPQQLNKPIYSYSLGILAFWAQILFYTLIGTHHFVFSSIPWSLQTVAIVGSVGMVIPVFAGTTNFLMTFKGGWYKLGSSYTLPFFLVGIIFYFTGSLQGTAEAFRSTNLIWHFTDFTVAHSHLTMYGIITFFMWAGIYAIVPRITGQEPKQALVGAHFWMALIGLMFYTVPLMYGSTLRGLMWIEGAPFIETVTHMAQHWLWRAIGGSLMWISHIVFAYNVYKMFNPRKEINVTEMAITTLGHEVKTQLPMLSEN